MRFWARLSFQLILMLVLLAATLWPVLATAQPAPPNDDYLLSADSIDYDQPADNVIARGAVEIASPERVINADFLKFDNQKDLIEANTPITITENDGTVLFAKDAKLSRDFKNGFANNVALVLPDNTKLAAKSARQIDGKYTVYANNVFSPCSLCITDPRAPPLWQMRAKKTVHDLENKDLIHRDVALEMGGIPVFYLPYLLHADPTVKRRSGFLSPSVTRNSTVGALVRVPYYYTFSPAFDYTFTPNFSGTDGFRWVGSLRKRFENGKFLFNHSAVIADRDDDDNVTRKDQFRGHINGLVQYNIDNVFRTGANFDLLTDKSYLLRYNEGSDDILTNRAYFEGFKGRNYGAIEAFYFQDNRPGIRAEQAKVTPRFQYSAFGEPSKTLGGRWSIDASALSLFRVNGADTRKLGLETGWERRDILPLGLVSTLTGNVRNDLFWADNLADPTTAGNTFNNSLSNRLFPQVQVKLGLPIGALYEGFSHTIEPLVALTASPTQTYNPRIPNEDSLDVEFDTTNLFDINRYSGTDVMEQGTRATYGIRTGLYANQGSYGEFTFGQNYRLTPDPQFPSGSGLDTNYSDYVGQLRIETANFQYPRIAKFDYQFRLDKDASNFRKHELRTMVGVPEFLPYFNYTFFDPSPTATTGTTLIEEMRYGFSTTIEKYYTFRADQVRDLRPATAGIRTTTLGLSYNDECFSAAFSASRDHTTRVGVKSGDTYFFRIFFKHLGGVEN